MEFLMGFVCAALCLGVFALGAAFGRRGRRSHESTPDTDSQRLRAEYDAFRRLQNYTVEDAYGQNEQEG